MARSDRPTGWLIGLLLGASLACNVRASPSPPPPITPTYLFPTAPPQPPPLVPESTASPAPEPTAEPEASPLVVPSVSPGPTTAPALPPSPPGLVYDDAGNLSYLELTPGEIGPPLVSRQLTFSGQDQAISVSPDGRQVLFLRTSENWESDLWVVGLDGSGERRLASPSQLPPRIETDGGQSSTITRSPFQIAWLAEGPTVAFNTNWNYGYGLVLADDLWLANPTSLALTQLLLDGEGGQFAFSPNGRWLLVVRSGGFQTGGGRTEGEVVLMLADGGDQRTLITFPTIDTGSEYLFYPEARWRPDSSEARLLIPSPMPWGDDASGTLWGVFADGRPPQRLGQLPGNFLFSPFVWSPDLSRLAYVTMVGEPAQNRGEIVLADGNGNDRQRYDEGQYMQFLGWSPDGARFLFRKGEPATVVLGQPDQPPQPLASTSGRPVVLDPVWLDPDSYVFVTGDYGDWELWLAEVSGRATPLAYPGGNLPPLVITTRNP